METSSTSAFNGVALRLALVAALVAIVCINLTTSLTWHCPFLWVLHTPCPTCGVTRAFRALLHADFAGAFAQQPLIFLLVPYLGALVCVETLHFVREGRVGVFLKWRWARAAGFLLALLLFSIWVARFFGWFGGPRSIW